MIARVVRVARAVPRIESAVLALAVVLLVGLSVVGERATPAGVASFSSFDAADGGYLALYELLSREGLRVDRFRSRPAFLDASIDTLVWAEPLPFDPARAAIANADADALAAWVRGGGRLLFIGDSAGAAVAGALHVPGTVAARAHPHVAVIDVSLRAAGVRRVIAATKRWRMPASGTRVLLDDGTGPLVVRYALGRGSVTAVVDPTLFTNAGIAAGDGARLALALAAPRHANATIAFDEAVHGYAVARHWWSVVPRSFVAALALAVCALLVAFAGAALRLGPPELPHARDDRTTAAFIDGLASLMQRGGAARAALADMLASTSHAAARAFGLPAQASNEEIAARIEPEELRAAYRDLVALAAAGLGSAASLLRGAVLAQRLRKEFAPHGPE